MEGGEGGGITPDDNAISVKQGGCIGSAPQDRLHIVDTLATLLKRHGATVVCTEDAI